MSGKQNVESAGLCGEFGDAVEAMIARQTPSVTTPPFRRQVAPQGWFNMPEQEEQDPFVVLQENFARWTERLGASEELASAHVYNNPDFTPLDARQHRSMLFYLLWKGEDLAVSFLALNRPEETAPFVAFIDDRVNHLNKVLREWHGGLEAQADIPESFKQAMRETARGEAMDMEEDLFAEEEASPFQEARETGSSGV